MTKEDIEDIIYLIRSSNHHNCYRKEDFIDMIKTPYSLRQYLIVRDEAKPICFATWAFPSTNNIKDYLLDLRFPKNGFYGKGENPWIIDFISLGGRRNTTIGFRTVKSMLSEKGYKSFFWLRTPTAKLGFHELS